MVAIAFSSEAALVKVMMAVICECDDGEEGKGNEDDEKKEERGPRERIPRRQGQGARAGTVQLD